MKIFDTNPGPAFQKLKLVALTFFLMFSVAGFFDLDVENPNDPDSGSLFMQEQYAAGLAGSLINDWFLAVHDYDGLALQMLVAADAGTCSRGFTRDAGTEPRIAFNNHASSAYSYQNHSLYMKLYTTLNNANDLLNILKEPDLDFTVPERARMNAVARFIQGLSLGYLGLIFDKGFVITDETGLTVHVEESSWKEKIAEAAARTGKLGEAADILYVSPSVTRGGLPPVPADEASISEAIHHERMVELMSSGAGIQFFQMRKEDLLQPGTPLHNPIPEAQLDIMLMDYYTFRGNNC